MTDGQYTPSDAVLNIRKGPDCTIEFSMPAPTGTVVARIQLSEAARAAEILLRYISEQTDAMEEELRKWVQSG